MYTLRLLFLLVTCVTVQAFSLADVSEYARSISVPAFSRVKRTFEGAFTRRDTCPAVWNDIANQLGSLFLSNGQCNDNARGAIRAAFHDCFNGACDGSLILAQEYSRPENNGLASICQTLGSIAEQHNVGTADLIQFAAAKAILTCPLGPTVPVVVGRTDSSDASPSGLLPPETGSGDSLYAQFQAKGFSAADLAALIGAHSTSKQFFVDPAKAGAAQDSTPGIWDVTYYGETLTNTAPFRFESDINLANQAQVGPAFHSFVANQAGWNAAFVSAMQKVSLMGVDASGLVDCTSALSGGTAKRDIKAAPIDARIR